MYVYIYIYIYTYIYIYIYIHDIIRAYVPEILHGSSGQTAVSALRVAIPTPFHRRGTLKGVPRKGCFEVTLNVT